MTKKLSTELRQKQVTQEALKIIAHQGLEGFSMSKLAGQVGLVPSGIYRHFKSKDDIVDAVQDFLRQRLFDNLEDVRQETSDAVERLHLLLTRHLKLAHENPALPRLMLSEVIFSGDVERRLKAEKTILGYLAGIGGIVGLGQEEGRIRADIQPETVAVMFLGLILPTIVLSQVTAGEFDVDSYADRAWRVFVEVIQGQSET